jgi:flagellar protein FlgJ
MSIPGQLKAASNPSEVFTDLSGLQSLRNNPDKDAALKQVAQQFESMFMSQLLKSMREANAVFEEDGLFNSNESRLIRDMYDNQLSLSLSTGQGTGLADVLYRQMSGSYGTQKETDFNPALDANWRRSGAAASKNGVAQPSDDVQASTQMDPARPVEQGAQAQRVAVADGPLAFVQELLPFAKHAASEVGVNPNVLVAQAALETGWGQYVLADENGSSNNLFNIKANRAWQGETVAVQALEFRDGVAVREQSQFKKYPDWAASFADYVALVKDNPRYASALDKVQDPQQFVDSLREAGYATDPQYTQKVMAVYRDITQGMDGRTTADAGTRQTRGG